MNTLINYHYRDASNYKTSPETGFPIFNGCFSYFHQFLLDVPNAMFFAINCLAEYNFALVWHRTLSICETQLKRSTLKLDIDDGLVDTKGNIPATPLSLRADAHFGQVFFFVVL